MSWAELPGWTDFFDIYDEAIATAPHGATLVEVGVAFGRSLAYLASRAIDAKRHDLIIIGVDPWVDDHNPDWVRNGSVEASRPTWGAENADWARAQGGPFNAFLVAMHQHAPLELERVRIMRGRFAQDVAEALYSETYEPLHMIFIDGDHRYEGVKRDIEMAQRLITPGGILAGHDYTDEFPGVVQAVAEMIPNAVRRGTSWYRPVRK